MLISFGLAIAGIFGKTPGSGIARLIGLASTLLAIIAVLGLIWWRVDAFGDRRYRAGVTATDAKWEEAARRLQAAAAASATQADDAAANRLHTFENQVAAEQESIDAAEANGSSPIDVLFGS